MRYPLNASLRTRLLLLVLFGLLPTLALGLYNAMAQRSLAIEAAQTNVVNLALVAAADHQQLINGARQLLQALSYLPELRQQDPAACSPILAKILADYPIYTNLAVLTPGGDVWCSALPMSQQTSSADRSSFQRALQTRHFALGGYQIGRISGQPALGMNYPILSDDGQVVAMLGTALSLRWLNRLAAETQLPAGATFYLFDENGAILARYPDPDKWVGQTIANEPLYRAVTAGGQGAALEVGPDGQKALFGLTALRADSGGGQVYLAIGIPESSIIGEVNRVSYRNLGGVILILCLALAATWFGSQVFFLRQFDSLLRATRRINAGDLTARAELMPGAGELGELAQDFNAMALELERRQEEQAQAQQALRESHERYRIVSDLTSDYAYAFRVEPSGLVPEWVTDAFTHITGYTVEESEARGGWASLIHPDDLPIAQRHSAALMAGLPDVSTFRILAKDGQVHWLRDYARPLLDKPGGRVVRFVGAAQDITARKNAEDEIIRLNQDLEQRVLWRTAQLAAANQELEAEIAERLRAEAALRASESELRLFIEQANDAIFLENEDDDILDVNARACEMSGYSRAELLAMKVSDLMPPEVRGEPGQVIKAKLAVGGVFESVDLHKDGTHVPVEVSARRIAGVAGNRVLAIVRDITGRKRAEEEIRTALAKEQELSELKSHFVSTTAHEFRTPLSAIFSVAQLLEQYGASFDQQKRATYLRRIQAAVQQTVALLNDILTIYKGDAGKTICQPSLLDLPALCADLVEEVRVTDKAAHAIDLTVQAPTRMVRVDEKLLRQILLNLLDNALKYSPAGSHVGFDLVTLDSHVTFQIRDQGIGIPEEEQVHLYEAFYRASNAANIPGSGLGLTIIKKSVDLHGGAIFVASKVGAGTVVTVEIPIVM